MKRQSTSALQPPAAKRSILTIPGSSSSTARPVTPALSETTDESDRVSEALSATIGEPLLSDYSVHELPDHGEASSDIVVDVALHVLKLWK